MATRPSLAVLMDPLETIKPAKDSTIAMLKAAAQRRCATSAFGQTFALQRGLTPRNPQSSAPAPVAQTAQAGKTQIRSLAHAG